GSERGRLRSDRSEVRALLGGDGMPVRVGILRLVARTAVLSIVAILAAALLPAAPSFAQLIPPPVVNPATYESRNGEFVLEVDPSHEYGEGEGAYRLTRLGREVWSGTRPFTLLGVAVGDDGVVAGHAYSAGLQGFTDDDTLHLLILDPTGHVR